MNLFTPPSHPAEIFLDTDMATDCDDVGAIAVLHTLANAGEARIRAVVVNNKDKDSARAVAALNTFYGRPDIPLGIYQGDDIGVTAGDFVRALAVANDEIPPAVTTYRRTLTAVPDGQALIVSIGHLNNLHDLLLSSPDAHSPLSGLELVRRKVAHLVVMGGDYPAGKEHNFHARGSHTVSGQTIASWPTPILFTGYTLGLDLKTGPGLRALPETHPLHRAYALHPTRPLENGRPSWDQTAVLAAVRGPDRYWQLSPPGVNHIDANGANLWQSDPDGTHAYLIEKTPPTQLAAEIESLMLGNP